MKKDNKKKFNPNNNPFLKNKQLPNNTVMKSFNPNRVKK